MLRLLLPVTAALLLPLALAAQGARVGIVPERIYPGENVLTISTPFGIDRITVTGGVGNVSVDGDGSLDCEKSHDLRVFVPAAHVAADVALEVVDCRGQRFSARIPINNVWTLDVKRFGIVAPDSTRCMMFTIMPRNSAAILDSVSVPDPRVRLRFFTDLPYRMRQEEIYRYEVCFTADDEPGPHRFPVVTWMRRDQPSGGHTTYPVADTGVVFILEPQAAPVADPTTFRSVAVPNAVIPPKGRFVLGVYDVLGVVAGYSVTDNVMILGGGAIPLPDDWGGVRGQMYAAASIGVKGGLALGDRLDFALGYQFARSIYDEERTPDVTESAITVHAPWGAVSYGDDDSRASLTLGYAMKHHVRPEIEFDDDALIAAIGGDYRFGDNWKVAGEIAYMERVDIVPIVATVRYFGDTYAIDAGLGFAGIAVGDAEAPRFPLLPVLSAVFVF